MSTEISRRFDFLIFLFFGREIFISVLIKPLLTKPQKRVKCKTDNTLQSTRSSMPPCRLECLMFIVKQKAWHIRTWLSMFT